MRVLNHYGPTETTVGVLTRELNASNNVSLGMPLANTQIYIVDSHGSLVPQGVPGEIWIGGAGVSDGYVGQPGTSAAQFIPDPFGAPGQRLYRSGDRGRVLADGSVQYLGRMDDQVKLRGYRFTLGDIEQVIQSQPGVEAVAVKLHSHASHGQDYLVGYVVGEVSEATLVAALASQLPAVMVPSQWVWLGALPRLANGKVDRRALVPPAQTEIMYVAPRNETEAKLATIWCGVLRCEQVSVEADFFALGGDSILSLQVIAQARQQGIVLTPKQFFEAKTIANMAAVAQTDPSQTQSNNTTVSEPIEEEMGMSDVDLSEQELSDLLQELES